MLQHSKTRNALLEQEIGKYRKAEELKELNRGGSLPSPTQHKSSKDNTIVP
jgi:hypothetical protein